MPSDEIGILGAGRQALETDQYCREMGLRTALFLEEEAPEYTRDASIYGAPILTFDDDLDAFATMRVVTAVGSHGVRRRLLERWRGDRYLTVISEWAWLADDVSVGVGSTVAPLAALNRLVSIGDHVLVNVGAVVAHEVVVGDFSTLSPRCTLGGGSRLGVRVFVGIGATISDHVVVGDGAVVAAGAVVIHDVGEHETVMGVPARPSVHR